MRAMILLMLLSRRPTPGGPPAAVVAADAPDHAPCPFERAAEWLRHCSLADAECTSDRGFCDCCAAFVGNAYGNAEACTALCGVEAALPPAASGGAGGSGGGGGGGGFELSEWGDAANRDPGARAMGWVGFGWLALGPVGGFSLGAHRLLLHRNYV